VIPKSTRLEYEPSSEPLYNSAKSLFSNRDQGLLWFQRVRLSDKVNPRPAIDRFGLSVRVSSEEGSYSRLTDFEYYSTLGLREIRKKSRLVGGPSVD